MKFKKVLPLFAVSFLGLTGCGGNSTPGGTTNYEISEADYLLLRSKLIGPRLFLDNNFTVSNQVDLKIANGKVDLNESHQHKMYDLDASTYDSNNYTCKGTLYQYDSISETWGITPNATVSLMSLVSLSQMYYLNALPSNFAELTYNSSTHDYTATAEGIQISFTFVNSKLVKLAGTGEVTVTFDFSNHDSTVITFPTV